MNLTSRGLWFLAGLFYSLGRFFPDSILLNTIGLNAAIILNEIFQWGGLIIFIIGIVKYYRESRAAKTTASPYN